MGWEERNRVAPCAHGRIALQYTGRMDYQDIHETDAEELKAEDTPMKKCACFSKLLK
jgi:hypothetical protein